MKKVIQYISVYFLGIVMFACNNNFLSEVPSASDYNAAASEILISPETGAKDYYINVPAGNANYYIVQIPGWLNVQSLSGQFTDNVATVNCSASVNADFSAIGVYKSSIVMAIENYGIAVIPVSYITQGNPAISTDDGLSLKYNSVGNDFHASLVIRNTGNGILLWSIERKSDWILIPDSLNNRTFMIPQNGEFIVDLSCDPQSITSPDLQGQILIASNDKNNGEKAVNLSFDFSDGNASFLCYTEQLDFGLKEVTQTLDFYNQGIGFMTWKVDDCPEWLTVSEASGLMSPHSKKTLVFTCDRSLLPNEPVSQTIYLATNDVNNPSYAVTVIVDNRVPTEEENPPTTDTE